MVFVHQLRAAQQLRDPRAHKQASAVLLAAKWLLAPQAQFQLLASLIRLQLSLVFLKALNLLP
jgi:hypothetical protein